MKSVCYVVLPDDLSLNDDVVYNFVRNQIKQYYSELEVEPYKQFFSKEETIEIAHRKGLSTLADFEEYLKTNKDDDGIENGLYYWITTFNTQGRWDGIRLDGVKEACELEESLPYSVVTPDGIWHSERDYGYKPLLDFEAGNLHNDNIEPRNKWMNFLISFFKEHRENNLAIIFVHS